MKVLIASFAILCSGACHAALISEDPGEMVFSSGYSHTTMYHTTGRPDCDLIVMTTAGRVVIERTAGNTAENYNDDGPMPIVVAPVVETPVDTIPVVMPPQYESPGSDTPAPIAMTPIVPSPVPLPGSIALFGGALLGLGLCKLARSKYRVDRVL